ncbi:divalent metal cation transporter [Metabacillus sp. GX 13764]|uniref:NRAMP family divalent metal transporter n=1 Tax=Metabacillus kandeliae TaxID=2900151 RepID=UPI001E38DD8E|nr:NRAMP family divalent metal transporter [Metabacillus kandeliae]MCD7032769.1 divalent metal cation transporter [Metabacillus kandeliae]
MKEGKFSILLGAAFLMATSAIGPGFLTQTPFFTESLAASFGFVILISIILDIGVQLNVWRIIAVSEKRAQDIANMVVPGLGVFISILIVIGGLVFNIGNIAGAGLGFNVLFGISPLWGAAIAAVIAIAVFLVKEAGKVMDRFAQIMGFLMIVLTIYVAFSSNPPYGQAAAQAIMPVKLDLVAIVTLVGGTVGGYITFAGGHRLLDAGLKGKEALPSVNRSAIMGISVASLMRIFLFLAALGAVSQGVALDPSNPSATVFKSAAGILGYKFFGIVLLAAAITSVIGSAYTSVSFIKTFSKKVNRNEKATIVGFIAVSTVIFMLVGNPVKLLVFAGALNGMILPITLAVMLVAVYKKSIVGTYKHPAWLTAFGGAIVIVMGCMAVYTLINLIQNGI